MSDKMKMSLVVYSIFFAVQWLPYFCLPRNKMNELYLSNIYFHTVALASFKICNAVCVGTLKNILVNDAFT